MSFRIVKFLIFSSLVIFTFLLFNTVPLLEFNNDHWLPEQNQYQQDLNYLEKEFQPGFGSLIVLKFPTLFFRMKILIF